MRLNTPAHVRLSVQLLMRGLISRATTVVLARENSCRSTACLLRDSGGLSLLGCFYCLIFGDLPMASACVPHPAISLHIVDC